MHEISLVRNIFSTLEEEFPTKFDRITGIHLRVGLLSNVQPILMQNAFKAVIQDEPQHQNKKLHIELLPVLIYCDDCHTESEVLHANFVCNICGNPSRNIVQGEELLISKIELAEENSSKQGITSN